MTSVSIFWPIMAQVALTFGVYILVWQRRVGALKSGNAKPSDFRVPVNEPDESSTAVRNLVNQFELPVLFYVCCLTLYVLGAVNIYAIALAWVFVASRFAHAALHVTTNRLRHRHAIFIFGFFIVVAMWGLVLLRLTFQS